MCFGFGSQALSIIGSAFFHLTYANRMEDCEELHQENMK